MNITKTKAIFLDRDGTIIVDKIYLNDPNAIEYLPGIFVALRQLRDQGFQFFVVTNQSGVPRGRVDLVNLFEIHKRIQFAFAENGVDIRNFYYAPYLTEHDHIYRKPNPGMLLQAAEEYKINLQGSWMIGDRMTDVEAGHRAGTKTILLSPRKNVDLEGFASPTGIYASVLDAVSLIVNSPYENQYENSSTV